MEQITVKRRETLLAVTEEPERVIEAQGVISDPY